ncbi:protein artemis-like isoform X2 [Corticium candelabrum]|uniref:protein artemis-like isoform X2 n=1 Tax=Corticium candelabrum TaxID=121492 RepID=UPI002E25ADD9|nr:protein artemis-like isoform X2 [Corticium candelabrum]
MSCFDGRIREYPGIIVDCFSTENCYTYGRVFFLSHCHKDHMEGLCRPPLISSLQSGADGIYCSEVTQKLLMRDPEFSHLKRHIKELPISVSTMIKIKHPMTTKVEEISVTLLPANHCPGSVMFLIEGQNGTVLFTGDFRLDTDDLKQMAALHCKDGNLKTFRNVYLDTTFCHPKLMVIPSRERSQETTLSLIDRWLSESPHHLVHLNCSTLGLEHIIMAVSNQFKTKIHVHHFTKQQYEDLPLISECLTTDCKSTRIHACRWKLYKSKGASLPCGVQAVRYDKPQVMRIKLSTIWFTRLADGFPDSGSVHLSRYNIWRIPHSMHSSMSEIRNVVKYLHPQTITPIVIPVGSTSLAAAVSRLKDLLDSTSDCNIIEFSHLLSLERPCQWSKSSARVVDTVSDDLLLSDEALSPPKRKRKSNDPVSVPADEMSRDDTKPVGSAVEDIDSARIVDKWDVESESDDESKLHSLSFNCSVNAVDLQIKSDCAANAECVDNTTTTDSLSAGGTLSSNCSECDSEDVSSKWNVCSTPGLKSRPSIHVLSSLHHKLSVERYLPLQCIRDLSSDSADEQH